MKNAQANYQVNTIHPHVDTVSQSKENFVAFLMENEVPEGVINTVSKNFTAADCANYMENHWNGETYNHLTDSIREFYLVA